MRIDHQATIFELIKHKLDGNDSLGHVLSEVLSISQDAVYRRYRGETLFTIYELEKISKHFDISLDALFGTKKHTILFDFQPLEAYEFSMARYLQKILDGLNFLKMQKNPEMIITVNNIPMLQMLNFPHLVRFKLWFWAKTHLEMSEYKDEKFTYQKLPEETFAIGQEVLRIYNSIPSSELYDASFLRGFVREVDYYFHAHHFADPGYAVYLLELLERFVNHLEHQAKVGQKFTFGTEPPASGNSFRMFHNETINGNGATLYKSEDYTGLYITHNLLNFLHTSDQVYVADSFNVVNKQIANSSMISSTNEKERNAFFHRIKTLISNTRKKMELELAEE